MELIIYIVIKSYIMSKVIINNKHLISGGQPAGIFEQVMREIAEEN